MEHRTSLGIFMALAANRPMTALSFLSSPSARIVRNASRAVMKTAAASTPSGPVSAAGDADLVDVDANLLHPDLASDIEHHIQVAASVGVRQFVVPGSTVEDSNAALDLANRKPNIVFPTAGVHPYHVEACGALDEAMASIAALAAYQDVRCVGECGLDFSEGFPPADSQLPWFERQVQIACELKKPLFLHEREAFGAFSEILRRYDSSHGLPPCLVHCFTGTPEEAAAYVDMGFFVSVAGGICREKNGKMLRDAVKRIPLDRLMVETDAPYLGFKGCRKGHANPKKQNPNVPSALPAVVEVVAGCLGIPFDQVAKATVKNSRDFLGIKER